MPPDKNVKVILAHFRDLFFKRTGGLSGAGMAAAPIKQNSLHQETFDYLLLSFLLIQTQRHELDDLLAGDLADGCLVDQ